MKDLSNRWKFNCIRTKHATVFFMKEGVENYTNYSGKREVRVVRKVHNHNKNVSCPRERKNAEQKLANRSRGKENERVETLH